MNMSHHSTIAAVVQDVSLIISRCQTFPSLWGLWCCYVDLGMEDFPCQISGGQIEAAAMMLVQLTLVRFKEVPPSTMEGGPSRWSGDLCWLSIAMTVKCVMKKQVNQLCDTLGDRMAAWRKVFPFHKLQISKSPRNLGAVGDLHLIWDHLGIHRPKGV